MPHSILNHQNYAKLSAKAVKLLVDLFSQFYGNNNGDFTAAFSVMHKKGWKSKDTLYKGLHELIGAGFIELTRQGGRHCCSLYAVTWLAIDDCNDKLDVAPTRVASGAWKK